jgi:glycosyltransferase involved in cell wall biosynthesis
MSNKKTFVILTPGFPGSETDTTCLPFQQNFVKALKKIHKDLNIVVLSFQYPYHKIPYNWFNVPVIPFNGRNKGGLARLLLRKKINLTLKKMHAENKIFGLLSFWYNECGFIGKKFGEKYGIKHYCWVLGQDAKKENKCPQHIPLRADELIALSDFLQNEFSKNHNVKPEFVIPPGIDERLFDDPLKEKDIDLFGAGSLISLKQYDIFLEVVSKIKKATSRIKVMLAGDGPEKEKLESLIKDLKLENNVTLTGELPHQEALKLMQRTKVFLHPSSYEGFSGACLEALYAGCHVISFSKPMKTDIINWNIATNKEKMTEKALNILKDPKAEYKIICPYPINDTANAIMKLFDRS